MVERTCKGKYLTFDDEAELISAQTDARLFISGHTVELTASSKTLAIDECQLVPKLFPALKLFVQRSPRPGQFLLTGSVRFTSRKAIQESLTGRIHTFEMLPMSFSDAHRLPLGDVVKVSERSADEIFRYVQSRAPVSNGHKLIEHCGFPLATLINSHKVLVSVSTHNEKYTTSEPLPSTGTIL